MLFSTAIHDQFFSKNKTGGHIIMSVDNYIFDTLCTNYEIDSVLLFREIAKAFKYDWNLALKKNKAGIPNFLGLIGIQIYAAHLRHKDDRYSSFAYYPRLCELLQIEKTQLSNLFSKFQEKIWRKFEKWAEQKGYFINLPPQKTGKGCYIQYPLSQSLLNQEDLCMLPLLFDKAGLKPFESLSFKDFKAIISKADHGNLLTSHYYRLKKQLKFENKIDILKRQIFSFYLAWEGNIPSQNIKNSILNRIENKISSDTLVLRSENLSSGIFKILAYDAKETVKYEMKSSDSNLFDKINQKYRLAHKNEGIILFIKNEDYQNEWDESRFLERNHSCLILCEKSGNYIQDYLHLLDKKYSKHSGKFYNLYQVNIKDNQDILPCHEFLFSILKRPFIAQNGLKLSRKSWMFGAGPDFVFDKPVRAWLNGEEIQLKGLRFSCKNLTVGKYVLTIRDHSPFSFFIEEHSDLSSKDSFGWQVNLKTHAWAPDENEVQISGLKLKFPVEPLLSEHRQWINALLGNNSKILNTETIVTKAIKRADNQC